MKLKRAIQLIENSNGALLIAAFIGIIAVVTKSGDAKLLVFEILFAIPFLLAYFFTIVLINIYLKKCKYPVVFLSVLDKLNLAKGLEIKWSEDAEKDYDKPTYPTEIFLLDNNLATDIGAKKIQLSFVPISIGLAILGLIYFGQKFTFKQNPILFGSILLFIAMNIYLWTKGKRQQNDNGPIVRFTDKGLFINNEKLNWEDIFDWNYETGGKNESSKIKISFYDTEKNIFESVVDLGKINCDKIDFMLLLTHFKAKYS